MSALLIWLCEWQQGVKNLGMRKERKGEILLHSHNKRTVNDLMKNFSIHVQKHHILSIYIQHVGKNLASGLKII